ncbi:hypothetical protein BV22DRAFT_1194731 [Leucogyrophana mollusca]|uniref:Uncharacterized protein n=1 Tax=Leucogyrophana mollusca TaxID=85980 RepID=A0ACB8BKT2_9AGAM|nr:hypothetical protein BV22DRAFT_1194731 [Leucogyrophana mollusca]
MLAYLLALSALAISALGYKRSIGNVDLINPSSIPSQCQSTCNAAVTTLNTCSLDVCCSDITGNEAEVCIDCIVAQDPTSAMITWGQGLLNELYSECLLAGHPIPALTVSYSGATATSGTEAPPSISLPVASTTTAASSGGGGSPLGTGDAVTLASSGAMWLVAVIAGGVLIL